jgi:hypothetical protein
MAEATMNLIARMLLVGALCTIAPLGAECQDKKAVPQRSAPLVTSDVSADKAAVWGADVVRAVAATEPAITDRHAAHLSTRMGTIEGGGMVFSATCKQKFAVSQVLAGAGKAQEREIAYSFRERAEGFPLPRPTRPVAKGEKVVLVLGVNGGLVKVVPDTDENRKEIEAVAEYVKTRPPAAQALLKAMNSFTLKIEYHGPKSDAYPSVWFSTNPKLPDKLPPKWLVEQNLSHYWAYQAVDYLVKAGMLKSESIDAERKRPQSKEPFYSLTLSADGVDEITFHLGWGKAAHERIETLGGAMAYNQEAIAKVLAKLKDEEERK